MSKIILRDGSTLTNQAQLAAAMQANPATVTSVINCQYVENRIDDLESNWSEATGGDLESVEFVNLRLLFEDFRQLLV